MAVVSVGAVALAAGGRGRSEVLELLDNIAGQNEAQTAGLREISCRLEQQPAQRQTAALAGDLAALARDVRAIRETLEPAGKTSGQRRCSVTRFPLASFDPMWLLAIPAVLVLGVCLLGFWYGLDGIWSAVRNLFR